MSFLDDNSISLFFATETWLKGNTNDITAKIKSLGFNIVHRPRNSPDKKRGGGVAIIHSKNILITKVKTEHFASFESICAKLRLNNDDHICLCSIYRPSEPVNQEFFSHLDEFLGSIFLKFTKFVICGDINLHLDNHSDPNTVQFNDIIASYGFEQFVQKSTHEDGHLLDIALTSNNMIKPNT